MKTKEDAIFTAATKIILILDELWKDGYDHGRDDQQKADHETIKMLMEELGRETS